MSTLGKHLLDSANTNGTSSTPGAQGSFGKVSTDGCGVQTDYEAKFSVLNQGLPALFKEMFQEIKSLRMRVGQLQEELQREKNEKLALQEANIYNTNDAPHFMDTGKSEYSSTEEHTSLQEDAKALPGWHGWLTDLKLADKALSRALSRLQKPVPIPRTLLKRGVSATGPLAVNNVKRDNSPWAEWFSPKEEIDNRGWSAEPSGTTTPTPDCPVIVKPSFLPPIPRPSPDVIDRIFATNPRPCFNHYLHPHGCFYKIDCNVPRSIHNHNVKRCQRSHEAEFTPAELEALRFVAHSIPCKNGMNCNRDNCYHGHHLPEEHPEGKLAPGAKTVKDSATLVDDNRDKGKGRRAARTAPDKVASLVLNDLSPMLEPSGQRENSNEPEDTGVSEVEWKTSYPVVSLLD